MIYLQEPFGNTTILIRIFRTAVEGFLFASREAIETQGLHPPVLSGTNQRCGEDWKLGQLVGGKRLR